VRRIRSQKISFCQILIVEKVISVKVSDAQNALKSKSEVLARERRQTKESQYYEE